MSRVQKALEAMARSVATIAIIAGDVASVDRDGLAIDVKPIDGSAHFLAVSLRAALDGGTTAVVQVPTKGSRVVIGVLGNSQAVLLMATAVTEVLLEVDGGGYARLDAQSLRMDAASIELGTQQLQPAVKGDDLVDQLTGMLDQLQAVLVALQVFAPAMATASVGVLAPMAAPATALAAALVPVLPQLTAIRGLLPLVKSAKTRIE